MLPSNDNTSTRPAFKIDSSTHEVHQQTTLSSNFGLVVFPTLWPFSSPLYKTCDEELLGRRHLSQDLLMSAVCTESGEGLHPPHMSHKDSICYSLNLPPRLDLLLPWRHPHPTSSS
ncbi:hypothetical protein R3I93_005799 [Phoxinus phoxinus]|uniref:Uncharacterized protein n=1 Tax=Phoxinus phoxinus TaxID=58324 RepID=A0AAN9HDK4_9TELE